MKIEDLRREIKEDELKDFQKKRDSIEDDFFSNLKEELKNDTSYRKNHLYKIMLWAKKKGFLSHLIYFNHKLGDLIYLIEENFGLDGEDEKKGYRNRMIISFFIGFLIPLFFGLIILISRKII